MIEQLGEIVQPAAQVVRDVHHSEGAGLLCSVARGQRPPATGMIKAQVRPLEQHIAADVKHLEVRQHQATLVHLHNGEVDLAQATGTGGAVRMPYTRFHSHPPFSGASNPRAPPAARSVAETSGTPVVTSRLANGLLVTSPLTARTGRPCWRRI